MRQRKIKDLETKMAKYQKYFINDACEFKGKWQGVFGNENDIYLELGCGKGSFIIQQGSLHPDRNYIGIEGQDSVIYRALQKLDEASQSTELRNDQTADRCNEQKAKLTNVRFACEFVNDPSDFFDDKELSGIYLNFSDPWPKDRHAHRRLTHKKYLMEYRKILKGDGFIEIKTDNDALFEFTINEVNYFNALKLNATDIVGKNQSNQSTETKQNQKELFKIDEITTDLHNSSFDAKNIKTEYEEKFSLAGKNINYMRLVRLT